MPRHDNPGWTHPITPENIHFFSSYDPMIVEAERRANDKLQKDFNDYAITNAKSEYAQSAIILVRNFLAISSLK